MADTRQLRTSLVITGDAAGAVKAALDLKKSQEDLSKQLDAARQAAQASQAALDAQTKKTDSLAVQTALAKKALQDLAAQGLSKTHVEYQALAGEIANNEAALKRELAALKQAESAHTAATRSVAGLEKQFQGADAALARQEERLKAAGVDVGNLAGEYVRLAKAQQQAAAVKAGSMDVSKLGTDASRAAASLNALGAQGSAALRSVGQQTAETTTRSGLLAGAVGRLGPAAIAAFAAFKVRQAAAEMVDLTKQVENLDIRLKGLTRGSQDYQNVENLLAQTAADHHKNLLGLAESEAKLLSIEKTGIITREQNKELLQGFSNVASEAGASTAQLGQVMYGLSQALASPVVHAEELNQVVEPLPGLLQRMDDAAGLPAGGLRKLVNAGQLTNDMFARVLVAALKTYEGAAKSTADSITASEADVENANTRLAQSLEPVTNHIVTEWNKVKATVMDGIRGQIGAINMMRDPAGKTAEQLQAMHDALVVAIGEAQKSWGSAPAEYTRQIRAVDAEMAKLAKIAPESFGAAGNAAQQMAQKVDISVDSLTGLRQGEQITSAELAILGTMMTAARQRVVELTAAQAEHKATAEQVAAMQRVAQQAEADYALEVGKAKDQTAHALKAAEDRTAILKDQSAAMIQVAEAEKQEAERTGDTAEALVKAGEIRQLQIQQANAMAEALQSEATAAQQYATLVFQAANADQVFDDAEQAAYASAQKDAEARQIAANAAKAQAVALAALPDSLEQVNQAQALSAAQLQDYRTAAQSALEQVQVLTEAVQAGSAPEAALAAARAQAAGALETYRQALATYTQQQQAASEAASRETSLISQGYDTRIAQVQALQAAAKARGDEAAAAQAGIQILQLEAAKSAALAEAKQREYEALLSVLDAKQKEAEADGTLTQAEQQALKAAQDAATAKRLEAEQSRAAAKEKSAEADGAKKAADAAQKQAGANKEQAGAQSQANKETKDSISLGITGAKVLEQYNYIILAGSDAWTQYRASVKLAQDAQEQLNRANTMAEQFQQAASSGRNLESLLSRLGVRSQDLGEITQSTARQFNLLDQQQLSGLNGAIQSAAQKLQAMRDSAQSLLSSLNSAALSQAASTAGTGDTTAANIAERTQIAARQAAEEFRARMAAINEQLAAARAAGDAATIASLTKAAELARQLYEQNLANLSEAAKKAAEDYQDSIEALNRSGKSYADDIADSIRDINREGMSAAEVQADMQAQLAEKIRKAQDAIRQGDLDYAKELQASIVQISKALGSSSSKNKDAAIKGLQAAKSLNDQIVKAQIGEIAKLKNAQLAAAKEVHDATMRYIQQEGEARANVLRSSTRRVTTTITAATGGLIAGEGQLVTTPTVPDGTSKSDLSPRNTTTKHFSAGGTVSGSGSGDTVPAMLTPGEVVLRKAAVQDLGVNLALDLNARGRTALRSAHVQVPTLPRQFLSAGGLVGQPAGPAAPEVTVRLVTDRGVTTARLPRDAATAAVLRDLKSAAAVRVGR